MAAIAAAVRTAGRAALFGGTALTIVLAQGALAPDARAQTERELELERKVQALEQEMGALKEQLQATQKQLDALAKQGPAKPVKVVESGEEDVSLKLSGQINRAVLIADDGTRSFVRHVDNDNSSTRMRFDAAARVTDDLSVKGRIEVELQANASDTAVSDNSRGLATDFGVNNPSFTARKVYVALESKTFGRLTLGQESMATDGVVHNDLSGTTVVMNSEAESIAGGVNLVNTATGSAIGVSINDSYDDFDGAGQFSDRQLAARYDSPRFLGFGISAAHGNSNGTAETVDGALTYSGKIWDTRVEAGIGFAHTDADVGESQSMVGGTDQNFVGGSVGLLHEPTGLNLSYAQGKVHFLGDGPDSQPGPSFWYVKAGWQYRIFSMGKTAISIDYGEYMNEDGLAAGGAHDNFGRAYGIALVQKIEKAATELYIGVKRYETSISGATDVNGQPVTGVEDVTAALTGARIKF